MKIQIFLIFFIISLIFAFLNALIHNEHHKKVVNSEQLGSVINDLLKKIETYQVLKPKNYSPPFNWGHKLGLFESDIHFMIAGGPIQTETRTKFKIFDNDMFSSGWILTSILESYLYGSGVPIFDSSKFNLLLDAIEDFHNRNEIGINNETVPIMTFWPQIFNQTFNIWQSQPDNVRQLCLNFDKLPWNKIEDLLRSIGLKKFSDNIEFFKEIVDRSIKAFLIPPDFDDTYLNIGLGATLKKLQNIYPDGYIKWSKANLNMEVLINSTIKYSYRPLDSDPNRSLIDPRTYFYARPFIQDAYKNKQKVSLITTWIQNIDEQRDLLIKGVSMPFNLNNVDVTVCANSIYGIASAALYDINGFKNFFINSSDLQEIFLNTTKFISWAIQTNYTNRLDLAQVYYPSNYNFLWYASRTLFLLTNELSSQLKFDNNLKDIFLEAHNYLQETFEITVTNDLYRKAKYDNNNRDKLYFDDFLGLNDTNIFGKMRATGEDRIFSTSQAINILIATWTYQDIVTKKLIWKSNTPSNAKYMIDSSIKWLVENVFNKKLKTLNAFFSGSVKGLSSLPYWYPSNYFQFLNGTFVNASLVNESDFENMFIGVNGIIDENIYESMLKVPHFGYYTPVDFPGFNVKDNYFPFWSSDAYTYSVALLAFAQYNNIS